MSFTLSSILKESKAISNFVSSEFVCKDAVGEIIAIDGKSYEIRMFLFQGVVGKTFADFVIEENLSHALPQIFDNGYAKLQCFLQSSDQKTRGVYFLLSVRNIIKH